MTVRRNEHGQPVGAEVRDWQGVEPPPAKPMAGRFCSVVPLDAEAHLDDLYEAYSDDRDGLLWTYMAVGPFRSEDALRAWLEPVSAAMDPLFHAVVDAASGRAVGVAAYMRIKPEVGVIEVGNIAYAPRLQRTTLATEAMFLMMQRVFDELGYRRYEWKCDALNAASRRAAERLGFSFDGIFEQALVYKGRSRDTAWYSILDRDWPRLRDAYLAWLDPANFDEEGAQKHKLGEFMAAEPATPEAED